MKNNKSMKPTGEIKFHGFLAIKENGKTELVEPCKEVKVEIEKFLNKPTNETTS